MADRSRKRPRTIYDDYSSFMIRKGQAAILKEGNIPTDERIRRYLKKNYPGAEKKKP